MKLRLGRSYTRGEIHNLLGGELQTYLPQSKGKIVCGCFIPEQGANPNAPTEILVGNAPVVVKKAYKLIDQRETIPVFLKRSNNNWAYIGMFQAKRFSTDRSLLRKREREAFREKLAMVLYLAKATG